jgi:hypothetical protein
VRVDAHEPRREWRTARAADGTFAEPEAWGTPKDITWSFKVRDGVAWRTSYAGTHYMLGTPQSQNQDRIALPFDEAPGAGQAPGAEAPTRVVLAVSRSANGTRAAARLGSRTGTPRPRR